MRQSEVRFRTHIPQGSLRCGPGRALLLERSRPRAGVEPMDAEDMETPVTLLILAAPVAAAFGWVFSRADRTKRVAELLNLFFERN